MAGFQVQRCIIDNIRKLSGVVNEDVERLVHSLPKFSCFFRIFNDKFSDDFANLPRVMFKMSLMAFLNKHTM